MRAVSNHNGYPTFYIVQRQWIFDPMVIIPEKKAVLLRLRRPERIFELIPGAKSVTYDGRRYVAVPHQIEVTQILGNLGIDVPSPIMYYYDWPGRFEPFEHQKKIAEFMIRHNRAFNLSDLGTGKTLATLWAYDYLRSRRVVNKALIVTPFSTLERTWGDEIFMHFSHLSAVVVHGDREKRLKLLDQDVDVYLINHDGIKVKGIVESLAKRSDIDIVIIDEIAQIGRNAGTDRFKALNTIINKQTPRRAWGLTGAPIPNSPTDAWAQCRLLVPERVPPYFNRFRDMVMRQVSQFTWVPRANALDVVYEVMQPAIRFRRDDCVDLPPCVYEMREVQMTHEQQQAYKDMLHEFHAEIEGGRVTAVNEAVKVQKLIQIACGVVYDSMGERLVVDATPRMNAVLDVIEQSQSKVIVFVPFISVIEPLCRFIEKKGHTVAMIHGGVSKHDRDHVFGMFQRADDPKVLVAQPAAMSHGLTLTSASTIVWYAPIYSNDVFEQANARITRPGQKLNQLIVMIEGTPIERKCYKRLQEKQRIQGVLLDMMKSDMITY